MSSISTHQAGGHVTLVAADSDNNDHYPDKQHRRQNAQCHDDEVVLGNWLSPGTHGALVTRRARGQMAELVARRNAAVNPVVARLPQAHLRAVAAGTTSRGLSERGRSSGPRKRGREQSPETRQPP
jgi:hypothetical protein